MKPIHRAYIEIHIAVILFGFTAILGKLIDLSAFMIVWWRVLLTAISIYIIIKSSKKISNFKWNPSYWKFVFIGILIAIHWLTFYGSIKYSNASVALICLATTSIFAAFLEPIILKTKIKTYEVLLGLIIIPAMAVVVTNLDFSLIHGVWTGLLSAFFAASFTCLNKKYIDSTHPYIITYVEMLSVWVFLCLLMPILYFLSIDLGPILPSSPLDWFYLLTLVLLCTTLAFILSLRALKHLSAFTSTLVVNLEPVYGVLLAIVLLNEQKELDKNFYLGSAIIVLTVMMYPYIRKKMEKTTS